MPAESALFLVTGAAGFVGGELVRHLAAHGVRVRAMVRNDAKREELLDIADEVVIGDLADEESLARAVDGVAGVYHIAAAFRQESADRNFFQETNVEGTRRLLDAAIAAGVPRFVHCSTVGVHGDITDPPADENSPFAPGDHYQESKLEAEQMVMERFRSGQIRGVVIRPAMVYGPGDQRTLKLFRMIAKGTFFYVGDGDVLLHWVDVRDLAAGFRQAMEAGHVNAEVFILAGAEAVPLTKMVSVISEQLGVSEPKVKIPAGVMLAAADITTAVCKPLGIDPPLYRRRVNFFLKTRAFDWSKAQRELGFAPAKEFADEVSDVITEYKRLNYF